MKRTGASRGSWVAARPPRRALPRLIDRRRLLQAAGLWTLAAGAAGPALAGLAATKNAERRRQQRRARRRRRRRSRAPLPKVNGAINIQPIRRFGPEQEPRTIDIVPRIIDLQMRALYELGFDSIRLTLSFADLGFNLLGAIPYVRAARALGIDVLGIVGQFGFFHDLASALADPTRREQVLDGYLALYAGPVEPASPTIAASGAVSFQIFNEPTSFLGLRPDDYVRRYLAPCYHHLKRRAPELPVVSAAPIGQRLGVLRAQEMIAAGVERVCDVVAFHIYDRQVIPHLDGLTNRPVWITETGAVGPAHHLPWVTEVYPEIRRRIPNAEQIFFFELFDLAPQNFRLLDIAEREDGTITSEVESTALHDELRRNVVAAAGGIPRARYEDLIPDITAYLPTAEDADLVFDLIGF